MVWIIGLKEETCKAKLVENRNIISIKTKTKRKEKETSKEKF